MATTGTALNNRVQATLLAPVPGGLVIATADDPDNPQQVTCEQTAPIVIRPPVPRYQNVDRPGRIGVPEWMGQDPYQLIAAIRIDGYPARSVEPDIRLLESFAEVPSGRQQPPALTVEGATPRPHPHLKWCLTDIADPTDVLFVPGGKHRCRYATTLTLTQHVDSAELDETLRATGASRGLRTRTTKVRPGENDLFTVARRVYGNPGRASDIAQANFSNGAHLRLGMRLRVGQTLRIPA